MPNRKRAPIEYKAQFADGMFRPRDVIEAELADADTENASTATPAATAARTTNVRNVRTNERTVAVVAERRIVRHSFDIGHDQLLALTELQTRRFSETGKKPKVGTLVQEALDAYIARNNQRTNERSVERPSEE